MPQTGNPYIDTLAKYSKSYMRFGMRLAEKLHIPNVFGVGGERDLKGKERAALRDAGYVKSGSNKWRNAATGDVIKGRKKAIRAARAFIRGGGTVVDNTPPPAPVPSDPYYPPYYGNEPWRPPETDAEYERTWSELGIEDLRYEDWWGWYPPPAQGFVGAPGVEVPPAYAGAAADVLGAILRGAWGILGVLWPSSTADDDEVWTEPVREDDYQGSPWGETEVEPQPMPQPVPRPVDVPLEVPEVWARPLPDPLDLPLEVPEIYMPRLPEPIPSTPTAAPWPWDPWSILESLPEYLTPQAQRRPRQRPGRIDLPESPPVEGPLTYAQPLALPYASNTCDCAAEKKRKRGDRCSNPIVRKRKATRANGRTYIYTTRELKCPESSRKKRASQPAR